MSTKNIPIEISPCSYSSVKAFDGKDRVVTFKCAPCPVCGHWLTANPAHKYCQFCGQALKWKEGTKEV